MTQHRDECCESSLRIFVKWIFSNNHRNVQNETQSSTLWYSICTGQYLSYYPNKRLVTINAVYRYLWIVLDYRHNVLLESFMYVHEKQTDTCHSENNPKCSEKGFNTTVLEKIFKTLYRAIVWWPFYSCGQQLNKFHTCWYGGGGSGDL